MGLLRKTIDRFWFYRRTSPESREITDKILIDMYEASLEWMMSLRVNGAVSNYTRNKKSELNGEVFWEVKITDYGTYDISIGGGNARIVLEVIELLRYRKVGRACIHAVHKK